MGAGDLVVAVDGIAYGMLLFLVSAGLTLTLGVARMLNLAHGALYLAGAYCGWGLADGTWSGLAFGTGVAVVVGAGAGTLLAVLLGRLPRPLDQALATIGAALIMGQVLTAGFGAEPLSVPPPVAVAGSVSIAGRAYPVYRLLVIVAAVALAAALWWVVARTQAGAIVRATADDPDMIAAIGIHPGRVRWMVLLAGSILASAAGAVGGPVLGPAPGVDHTVLILSLAVAIAGGLGSIPGALLAALVVGQVQTTAVSSWPSGAPYLVYAVLALALAARALLARRRRPA